MRVPLWGRGAPPQTCTFALPELPCYNNPQASDLVPRSPSHRKGIRSLMRRNSLISSRPTRALRERPATDTRLLPSPFPPGDGRSIDSPRHTCLPGLPRGCAPSLGRLAPAMREGLYPDFVGSPEGIAPRDYSPVFPLGDPLSPGDGKESALPSLRMVERLPHTDRPQGETPSSPADLRVWRSLAPPPLRPGHGPSIAYPALPFSVLPDPRCGAAHAEATRRVERGVAHIRLSRLAGHPRPPYAVIPSPPTSTKLGASACARAQALAPVFLSPSRDSGQALRAIKGEGERETKGVRVSSPILKQSKPCLKPQNNQKPAPSPSSFPTPIGNPSPWGAVRRGSPLHHAKSPENPLGVVQSNQLRVQSTFNQRSIKTSPHPLPENRRPPYAIMPRDTFPRRRTRP